DLYMTTRPESLFYLIICEDSFLNHRQQLSLAVALVRAKAPKLANWFYSRYKMVLPGKSEESIDLLAAVIQFVEIMELTHAKVKLRSSGSALHFDITSPAKRFPRRYLARAARELQTATGRNVKTMIHLVPSRAELPRIASN
ncbi:MAG TPA: hypothetical protein VFE91_01900, partial [Nitrososphaerales archaeon]|nr:hypothetical protein [Nitrososphaerales archaeon]